MEEKSYKSFQYDQLYLTHKISYKGKAYTIAQYERGKNLSNGGFADVYEVKQISSAISNFDKDRQLIAKLLPVKDHNSKNIYQNELKALGKIKELGIQKYFVNLQDCWKDENYYYLLFQKCTKGSLYELLHYSNKYQKNFKKQHILYFVHSILKALDVLHYSYIINRDVKLENVLIDDNLNLKLTDFGASWTQVEGRFGTPYYMAPEALKQDSYYSEKVDIWSLGVSLYYILFSRYPITIEIPKNDNIQREDLYNILANKMHNFKIDFTLNKENSHRNFQKLVQLSELMLQKNNQKRKSAAQLLSLQIFKDFNADYETIIRQQLSEYYRDYLNQKSCNKLKQKQTMFSQLQLPPQIGQILMKPHKVRITEVLRVQKFGFFLMLSNNSFFAYFNDRKLLKYEKDQFIKYIRYYEQRQEECQKETLNKINKMKILIQIKNKFKSQWPQRYENQLPNQHLQSGFEFFRLPDCSIKKIQFYPNKNMLFVRLSNQTIQAFFQQSSQEQRMKDKQFITQSVTLNNNKRQMDQIIYRKDKQVFTYKNFEEAAHQSSVLRQNIEYIQSIFKMVLLNNSISLQKYRAHRQNC